MALFRRGVTRRDPRKSHKDTLIPTAASIGGGSVTSGQIDPDRLGTGTRDGTKFLRDDGTWQTVSGGGGVGARGDVVQTTASLADGAEESDTIALGISFIPLRVEVDRACRLRVYSSAAARTADAAREPGTDPTGEHGVIFDVRLDAITGLIWDLQSMSPGANMEASPSEDIPYLVKNESGSTGTIEITVTRILLESP